MQCAIILTAREFIFGADILWNLLHLARKLLGYFDYHFKFHFNILSL
jgi:hypothetical protein